MSTLSTGTLAKIFFRSYLINSAYNTRGLQGVGFIHAMAPGLASLYPEPAGFSEACRRYTTHYNCHPYWTPMLLGAFLHLEEDIASGRFPKALLTGLKETTMNTLSAVGDSFLSGSIIISWALITSILIIAGFPFAALLFSCGMLFISQCLHLFFFWAGLTYGLKVLSWLGRADLINLGDSIKLINALLLLVFLALSISWIPETTPPSSLTKPVVLFWLLPLLVASLAAWATAQWHLSRSVIVVVVMIFACICIIAG